MSHFTTIVITKDHQEAEELLEPYAEGRSVPAYKQKCWCIGQEARKEALETAEREYKSIEKLRQEYWNLPQSERPQWENFILPFHEIVEKEIEKHPLKDKQNLKCESCKGTGEYLTTYNPQSKWDWYEMGGRWTGFFKLKKGAKGELGEPGLYQEKPKKGYIDSAKIKDIDFQGMGKDEYIPFAIVTSDGMWHERGNMGWFAIVTDEKPDEAWSEEVEAILVECDPEDRLTLFDLHI